MKALCALACLLVLTASPARAATAPADNFYLRARDRVVFYGDSITDQRLYTTYVESYVVTRWPRLNVSFVTSGWGGDRVVGGAGGGVQVRLARDVLAHRPTVVTVMLGMNDAGYAPFNQRLFDDFASGYRQIVRTLKAARPGLRITLLQPSPYDDVTRPPAFAGGYNAVVERYGAFVRELAAEEGLTASDMNAPLVDALRRAHAAEPALALMLIPDRVHPVHSGHLLMAQALLESWHAPALVSAVEIDAAAGRTLTADNTRVNGLRKGSGLSWTQVDGALPMPVDPADPLLAPALKYSRVLERLNRQTLKVVGLKAGAYDLRIDGGRVGGWTAGELASGVNLAERRTPMLGQALAVHALTLQHNDIHLARWRMIQVALETARPRSAPNALRALDALEAELVRRQRAAAQPKPRRYELTPRS